MDYVAPSATQATTPAQIAKNASKLTDNDVLTIHQALKSLAKVCDGAVAEDGAGFNGLDAGIGHSLADCKSLTRKQAELGRRVIKKYHRQIGDVESSLELTA